MRARQIDNIIRKGGLDLDEELDLAIFSSAQDITLVENQRVAKRVRRSRTSQPQARKGKASRETST